MQQFNHAIDTWITALEQYSFIELCIKPSATSWSLGQLYIHLINDTNYYIEQIKICVLTNDNVAEKASPEAETMFMSNSFPDKIIEGDPASMHIAQPDSKEQLVKNFLALKEAMNNAEGLISKSVYKGKTKHPGLNYFSASQWLHFADMHLRHHLKQKKRIDDFLSLQV